TKQQHAADREAPTGSGSGPGSGAPRPPNCDRLASNTTHCAHNTHACGTRRKSTWLPPEQAPQNGCESDDKQSNKQSKTTSSTAQHAALDSTTNTHANPTAPRSTTSSRTVAAAKTRSQTHKSSIAGATNVTATEPNAANRRCRND